MTNIKWGIWCDTWSFQLRMDGVICQVHGDATRTLLDDSIAFEVESFDHVVIRGEHFQF